MIRASLSRFAQDESGAVTVDWVVLTAAIVGLTVSLFTVLTPGTFEAAANRISDRMVEASEYAREPETVELPEPQEPQGNENE